MSLALSYLLLLRASELITENGGDHEIWLEEGRYCAFPRGLPDGWE